jgi:hypothetical protein
MLNTTTRLPHRPSCPHCLEVHKAATALADGEEPGSGAISICLNCGELGRFEDDMSIRKLTDTELYELQRQDSWGPVEQLVRGRIRAWCAARTH